MDKKEITNMFKNNVIDWYDFRENESIFHLYDENEIRENYDYIIIHDNLELLNNALNHLNQDGTIILLLRNKFGLSNFVTENGFEKNKISFSKMEIEQKLMQFGLSYKFFYPLPNNEVTNCVFSDDYLPEENSTKINNNILYDEIVYLDENQLLKKITKLGKFTEFTNCYFVEVNPKTGIKFASYNNLRNEQYRICTRIYNDYVEKIPVNDKSISHINQIKENIEDLKNLGFNIIDKYENEKIISKYINEKSFYQIITEKICDKQIDEAVNLIKKWFDYINGKMINSIKKYVDLTFENTFYIDGEFLFFDQEWVMENIPSEFILYRSINNMYIYNSEIAEYISKIDLLRKFDIHNMLEEFSKIEQQMQKKIINEELKICFNDIVSLQSELNVLREKIIEKGDTIKYYQNMRLVKLTDKLHGRKK